MRLVDGSFLTWLGQNEIYVVRPLFVVLGETNRVGTASYNDREGFAEGSGSLRGKTKADKRPTRPRAPTSIVRSSAFQLFSFMFSTSSW